MTVSRTSRKVKRPTPSVRLCPTCGSAAVEFSDISGEAECLACAWVGKVGALLVSGCGDTTALELSAQAQHEFVGLVASAIAAPVLRWLIKYGFVENNAKLQQAVLRYVKAGTIALYKSILETRLTLAKEKSQ